MVNSLAPGRFDYSLKLVNLKLISTINILSIFCEIATVYSRYNAVSGVQAMVPRYKWEHDISGLCVFSGKLST